MVKIFFIDFVVENFSRQIIFSSLTNSNILLSRQKEKKLTQIKIGLTHLCEFIEDCEFTYLSNKVLHVLGKEGPSTTVPSRYIRYIYNRISLENASVRASAVSALAKFAVKLESLRPSITILLRR